MKAVATKRMIISSIFSKGLGHALEVLILDVAFQRRTYRRRKLEWLMHILIFWGWIGLLILTIVAAAAEFTGPFILGSGPEFFIGIWKSLELPNNIFGWMLVVGIVIAIARRLFSTGKSTFSITSTQALPMPTSKVSTTKSRRSNARNMASVM